MICKACKDGNCDECLDCEHDCDNEGEQLIKSNLEIWPRPTRIVYDGFGTNQKWDFRIGGAQTIY